MLEKYISIFKEEGTTIIIENTRLEIIEWIQHQMGLKKKQTIKISKIINVD